MAQVTAYFFPGIVRRNWQNSAFQPLLLFSRHIESSRLLWWHMNLNRTSGSDLLSGEKVQYLGKVLRSYHFSMLPVFLLFEALILSAAMGVFSEGAFGGKVIFGLFLLAPFLLFVESSLAIRTTILAVTNQRVVVKAMTLTQRISCAIPLDQIESVDVKQGIIGTMYGYGTVSVNGTGGRSASVPGIENPFEFEKIVQEAINLRRGA